MKKLKEKNNYFISQYHVTEQQTWVQK